MSTSSWLVTVEGVTSHSYLVCWMACFALTSFRVVKFHCMCFCLYTIICMSVKPNGWTHTNFKLQYIFLSSNTILMDICHMLLLQRHVDIYSVLNEKKLNMVWFVHIDLCLAQPTAFDSTNHCKDIYEKVILNVWSKDMLISYCHIIQLLGLITNHYYWWMCWGWVRGMTVRFGPNPGGGLGYTYLAITHGISICSKFREKYIFRYT